MHPSVLWALPSGRTAAAEDALVTLAVTEDREWWSDTDLQDWVHGVQMMKTHSVTEHKEQQRSEQLLHCWTQAGHAGRSHWEHGFLEPETRWHTQHAEGAAAQPESWEQLIKPAVWRTKPQSFTLVTLYSEAAFLYMGGEKNLDKITTTFSSHNSDFFLRIPNFNFFFFFLSCLRLRLKARLHQERQQ